MKTRGWLRGLGVLGTLCLTECSSDDSKSGGGTTPSPVIWRDETPTPIDWPASVSTDTQTLRSIELVVLPQAQHGRLAELEIPVTRPQEMLNGEQVLKIVTTGADAENLRRYGFVPSLPRLHAQGGVLAPLAASPIPSNECAAPEAIDTADCDFPLYDKEFGACRGGIEAEIATMTSVSSGITVTNSALASSYLGRRIATVRIGPDAFATPDIPTHYVFATHHAREWMTTAVTMKLIRWLNDAVNKKVDDPALLTLLRSAAIVFVPVVNPDGYQFSHAPGGNRSWRGNRHLVNSTCASPVGVDLNRNYAGNFGDTPVDSANSSTNNIDCAENYQGQSAASEPETVQMQNILSDAIPRYGKGTARSLSAMSYHSWGDLIIYPAGYKRTEDASGPRCFPNANCLQPDFLALRTLFGTDRSPHMKDAVAVLLGKPVIPYFADQERSNGYTTTGDLTQYASGGARQSMLAVTPELGGSTAGGFYPECLSKNERKLVLDELFKQQKAMIMRMLEQSVPLASGYAKTTTGTLAGLLPLREKVRGRDDETAVPRLLILQGTNAGSPSSVTYRVNGADKRFDLQRRGTQYNVYAYEMPVPMTLPCEIKSLASETGIKSACVGVIDLCNGSRLSATNGWAFFKRTTRVGQNDCGYFAKATTAGASVITLPSSRPVEANTTMCHATFTVRWSAIGAPTAPIRIERFTGGQWVEITRWPLQEPFYEIRTSGFALLTATAQSLRSYSFEVGGAGGTATDAIRFVYDSGAPGSFELLDAVTYCRSGSLN
jgi:Zinc carboxypeptidase